MARSGARSPGTRTHTLDCIACALPPLPCLPLQGSGVGSGLLWYVVVDGLSSSYPRTGYHPPLLHRVGLVLPNSTVEYSKKALASLPTVGGVLLRIEGDFFGPSHPGFVEGAFGVGSTTGTLAATDCAVLEGGQTAAECRLTPGVGTGFQLVVRVAGQDSEPAAEATLSFAAPVLMYTLVASPSGGGETRDGLVPTTGGALVTLVGTNLGSDPNHVVVRWGGVPLTGVRLAVAHSAIAVVAPVGEGVEVEVEMEVGGQTSNVYHLLYAPPAVDSLSISRSGGALAAMDCSVVGRDGRPLGLSQGNVTVVLRGRNFGLGQQTRVDIGGVPCSVLVDVMTHSIILCVSPMCQGVCYRAVAGFG